MAGDDKEEIIVSTASFSRAGATPTIKFEFANRVATDALPRDRTQSQRLHDPAYRIDTIDPMTGDDIKDITGHPFLVDGNMTVDFTSEATRRAYIDLPLDHPNLRLPGAATDGDGRGG